MENVFNSEFYEKLHTLRMSIAMRLASGMSGGRKSNAKGSSVEFSDFREYRLGDDIRRIDWNAYGRFDRLYIKLFMEEKEGIFNIFLDTSKSMDFGERNKAVCALRVAGALSYVVLENSDRLYLNLLSRDSISTNRALAGRQAFIRATDYLSQAQFDGDCNVSEAIHKKTLRQRGTSILITDGYGNDWEEVFKYLKYHNQEVVFVQVLSKEEEEPEFDGTVNLIDSENAGEMRITMSSSLVKQYRKSYTSFIDSIQTLCKKYSVTYIKVRSDESMDSLFFGALTKIAKKQS